MMSRGRLKAVKATYRESCKRKLILACINMEKFLNTENHLEFHEHLEEVKKLIRHADATAEINYFAHKE